MKARFKGDGEKTIKISNETIKFPSGKWVVLPTIAFFNRIKNLPTLFDIAHDFDLRPFLKFAPYVRFGARVVRSDHKPTIRVLSKMKDLTKQAELPELGEVIYRINSYPEVYLDGFVSLKEQVKVLCTRKKGGIGDVIMTLPALEAIHNKYPNYVIDYACPTEYLPLVENVPFINQAFRVEDIDQEVYDIVYDVTRKCIQYEGRTQPNVDLNRSEIFANILDIPSDKLPRTKLFLSDDEVETSLYIDFEKTAKDQRLVKQDTPSNDKLLIGICVDSSAKVRSYVYVEELLIKISKKYPEARILFFQKENRYELNLSNVHNIVGQSFRNIMMMISRCDFFFGPDSGLTHIAASFRVPTLWFFTHIDGKIRTRGYDTSEVMQDTPPSCPQSAPCWYLFSCDPDTGEHLDSPHCALSILPNAIVDRMGAILHFPFLSIVVLCHNRFEMTKECIDRIAKAKRFNDEIILVDNGSDDETQEYFSKFYVPNFYYYRHDKNTGCVSGRNFASKQCQGSFIWFLDNDQFIKSYSLQKIMQTEGDFVGVEGWFIKDDGLAIRYDKCGVLNYVGAGGLLTKLNSFKDVGGFDEHYNPAWFEDPDLCFKATEKDYSLGLCQNANIEHLPHSTNHSQNDFHSGKTWARNRKYFIEKWKHLRIGKPIVSIVILTHNDSDTTIRCLNSIYQSMELKHFECIVVDNGSEDNECSKLLQYQKPNLKYIFNETNLMVAAGRNVGAKKATGEFILFLDNDMIVPKNWLMPMLANLEQENCVATSPKVVDLRDGKEIVRFIATIKKKGIIYEIKDNNEIINCDFLPGGAMLVKQALFEKFPFDEKFIFGVEDYDWCIKVRNAGYNFINSPFVQFLHAKVTKERTVTLYDDMERERKGSSYIEDSIRLFLYRYQKELPNQWKQSGWLQWAIGRKNQYEIQSLPELMILIEKEIVKLYPDEIIKERFILDENISAELGNCG
jgi:GT2 family glycosyltransferase/ADP-heptose:LPS heptosyltransferase